MKKILVIEDELSVKENLVELLEAEDFEVYSTEHGLLGALWAQENQPDLIVCDVMMPEIDGYEVLNALREVPLTASIPFIFLTAMADKSDIRHGMDLGADDYLTKPFTRDELLKAIRTRIAKQEISLRQYELEHQRAEALQKKIKDLEQSIQVKDKLLKNLQQDLQKMLPKLNLGINIINKLKTEQQRNRGLEVLAQQCADEIDLLKEMPHLKELLSPEATALLEEILAVTELEDFSISVSPN